MAYPRQYSFPRANVARGKLAQAIAYGARIVLIDGNFDLALSLVKSLHREASYRPCQLTQSQ